MCIISSHVCTKMWAGWQLGLSYRHYCRKCRLFQRLLLSQRRVNCCKRQMGLIDKVFLKTFILIFFIKHWILQELLDLLSRGFGDYWHAICFQVPQNKPFLISMQFFYVRSNARAQNVDIKTKFDVFCNRFWLEPKIIIWSHELQSPITPPKILKS